VPEMMAKLAKRNILVNGGFEQPFLRDYIRVTVGGVPYMRKFWRVFIDGIKGI
jgi:histidinol-phosphate/aromatic aminotransferase/cobyric acid decarboxylase-like protein